MRGTYLSLLAGLALALFAGVGATGRLAAQTPEIQEKVNAELARKRAEEARAARTRAERELAEARDEAAVLKAQLTKERERAEQLQKEARAQAERARAAVEEALQEAERLRQDTRAQRARQDAEAALKRVQPDRDLALIEQLERTRLRQGKAPQGAEPAAVEAMVKDLDQRAARLRQDYEKRREALLTEVQALDARVQKEMARLEEEKAAVLTALKERAATQRATPRAAVGDKLDRILERLDRIEKRLDRLEKMPLRAVPRLPRQPADNPFFERK